MVAVFVCSPVAHDSNSFALALSIFFVPPTTLSSCCSLNSVGLDRLSAACLLMTASSVARLPVILVSPIGQEAKPATDRRAREAVKSIATNPPVHAGGFFCNSRRMPERADDELKLLLARAFDRAWKRYYRPTRIGAISPNIARPALAKHLIALAKEGVVSLEALAEGGLLHLVSLTPEAQNWGRVRIESAGAKFQREWRVRLSTLKDSKTS
jgi:hypothetical protein